MQNQVRKLKLFIYFSILIWFLYLFFDFKIFSYIKNLRIENFVISLLSLLVLYYLSGLQMSLLIEKKTGVVISFFDKLFIPISQNFWGYILPFQGSLIYIVAILKHKYNISFQNTIYINIFSLILSLWIGAIMAVFHSIIEGLFYNFLFFLMLSFLPAYLIALYFIVLKLNTNLRIFRWLKFHIINLKMIFKKFLFDKKLLILILFYDFIFVLVYACFSYYLSELLHLEIGFFIWFLWSYFLKLTLIAKITPGNLGLIQGYTVGFLSIYGYPPEHGLLISMIQLALIVLLIFPLAIVNSIFNWQLFKKAKLFSRS